MCSEERRGKPSSGRRRERRTAGRPDGESKRMKETSFTENDLIQYISYVLRAVRRNGHHIKTLPQDIVYFQKMKRLFPELRSYNLNEKVFLRALSEKKGFRDFREYYYRLLGSREERAFLKSNFTYLGSHFFRGNDWPFFRDNCLSGFSGRRELKIWCAGCATGQEVYSLIMALLDYVPLEEISVLATDYNDRQLETTEKGDYSLSHLHEIPDRYRHYVSVAETRFIFPSEMRARIQTQNLNLLTDPFPAGFDIILCRNVLKFFSPGARAKVQKKLAGSLKDGGILFLAHDNHFIGCELIRNPASLGLRQLGRRPLYRKER